MNSVIKFILRILFICLRVRVKKTDSLPSLRPVVYMSNHKSTLDVLYLYAFLPKNPIFFLPRSLQKKKHLFSLFGITKTFVFEPLNPTHAKEAISWVEQGNSIVIFAEDKQTTTGGLMKIYETAGIIADKTDTDLVPVYIQNAEYSLFANTRGGKPVSLLPPVTIYIGKKTHFKIEQDKRKNREHIVARLSRLMSKTAFNAEFIPDETLLAHFIKTAKRYRHGFNQKILEDAERHPLGYRQILCRIFCLGKSFTRYIKEQETVGVLLPTSTASILSFLSLTAYGRVPAMLNPTSGEAALNSVIRTAKITKIITSEKVVELLGLGSFIENLLDKGCQIIYLESLKFSFRAKVSAFIKYLIGYVPFKDGLKRGCILFTSGSEGDPKAVVLSQSNMLANVIQYTSFETFSQNDIFFNALPLFHSFGLTIGTLVPLLTGSKLFLYPSPLHYRVVPELIYEIGATVMYSTDTFLRGYARSANCADFQTMHLIMAGAEAVKQDTRDLYAKKFGVCVQEGYGATECAPLITANSANLRQTGSIGPVIPALDYRITPMEHLEEGGILEVKGPNVMMGYMYSDNPGKLVPVENGWYSTGDIVKENDEGFIFILDRVKRFAKIAGEMVSLGAVEKLASSFGGGEFEYGAVAVPHPIRGEQVILVSTNPKLDAKELMTFAQQNGVSELYVPKTILHWEEIPTLATGKRDNKTLKAKVLKALSELAD